MRLLLCNGPEWRRLLAPGSRTADQRPRRAALPRSLYRPIGPGTESRFGSRAFPLMGAVWRRPFGYAPFDRSGLGTLSHGLCGDDGAPLRVRSPPAGTGCAADLDPHRAATRTAVTERAGRSGAGRPGHAGPAAGHGGQRADRLGLGPVRGGCRPLRRHPRAAPASRLLALRGRRPPRPCRYRGGNHPQPGAGGRAGLGGGRRPDRGGRPRPRRTVGRSGRGTGGGHLSVRLVQRLDRGHLLLRHGRLPAPHHPGLAGPAGQLARRGRGGRPRAPGRFPPVDHPVVRRPGPHRRGGLDPTVEPSGR